MIPNLELNDGQSIPQVALGLWQVTDEAEFNATFDAAVKAGYRHFDSAQVYNNEHLLGEAIERHGLQRQNIFVTTKIDPRKFGRNRTPQSVQESLKRLHMEYVDLLLLHFPVPLLRAEAWRQLEKVQEAGRARSIGVSNYGVRHLQLMKRYAGVVPAVNQIELHVFLQQPELVEYCNANNIAIEAYSPLAHAQDTSNVVVQAIAEKHGKTYAQVMLRWCVQQNAVILPKSKTPSRIIANLDVFDFNLDADDLEKLKAQNRNQYTCRPTRSAKFMP